MVAIAQGAALMGRSVRGGPIAGGRVLEAPFYRVEGGTFLLTLPWAEKIQDTFSDLLRFDGAILACLGFNSHRFTEAFAAYCRAQGLDEQAGAISSGVFRQTVIDSRKEALGFYLLLAQAGKNVFFTCSPQRVKPGLHPILRSFEDVLIEEVRRTGATFLDVRPDIMDGALSRPEFANPGDAMHGNANWGRLVLEKLDAATDAKVAPASANGTSGR